MVAEELFPEWSFLFWQANRAFTYESHGAINTFGERQFELEDDGNAVFDPSARAIFLPHPPGYEGPGSVFIHPSIEELR
jgi:hypothetical protein